MTAKATIKILYDNCKEDTAFQEDWGFSALIEMGQRKLLFDTGNNLEIFLSNAKKMGLPFAAITDVVFSHKHRDHTTGCKEILSTLSPSVRVFLPKGFPTKKMPQHLQTQKVGSFLEINPGIYLLNLKGGPLLHEQSLILKTSQGLVILTGCAHPGIINIVKNTQQRLNHPIYLLLGGFHLFDASSSAIQEIVAQTQSLPVQTIAPCHCSGEKAIQEFQRAYTSRFYKVGAGTILTI